MPFSFDDDVKRSYIEPIMLITTPAPTNVFITLAKCAEYKAAFELKIALATLAAASVFAPIELYAEF